MKAFANDDSINFENPTVNDCTCLVESSTAIKKDFPFCFSFSFSFSS